MTGPDLREQLEQAAELRVDSVVMPVQSATDLLAAKLLVLTEHYCDLARLFPHVRALREQVDWPALRRGVDRSPFARAFLGLCAELDLLPDRDPAEESARDLTSDPVGCPGRHGGPVTVSRVMAGTGCRPPAVRRRRAARRRRP